MTPDDKLDLLGIAREILTPLVGTPLFLVTCIGIAIALVMKLFFGCGQCLWGFMKSEVNHTNRHRYRRCNRCGRTTN